MAKELPKVNFLVLGSVSLAFQNESVPVNVGFMGVVDDETKNTTLGLADVALNPMAFGSGTNLKMLDYFASGVPVVSTLFGARGLDVEDSKQCIIAELKHFSEAITRLKDEDISTKRFRVENAMQHAQTRFDWATIASNLSKRLVV